MLTDLKIIIQKRRELRARTMDALHGAGIEIASRLQYSASASFRSARAFIPRAPRREETVVPGTGPRLDRLRQGREGRVTGQTQGAAYEEFNQKLKDVTPPNRSRRPRRKEAEALAAEKNWLEKRLEWLQVQIERQESKIAEDSNSGRDCAQAASEVLSDLRPGGVRSTRPARPRPEAGPACPARRIGSRATR